MDRGGSDVDNPVGTGAGRHASEAEPHSGLAAADRGEVSAVPVRSDPPERAGSTEFDAAGQPTSFSYSQLSSYATCPRKYFLTYRDPVARAVQTSIGAAIAGSAIHTAIEEAELNGWPRDAMTDRDRALEWLQAAFLRAFAGGLDREVARVGEENIYWGGKKTREWPDGETVDWWVQNQRMFFIRYLAIRRNDNANGVDVVIERDELPWIEKRVAVMIDRPGAEPLRVSGMVDILMYQRATDGLQIIRDWKSGRWLDPFQLAVYAWLILRSSGELITTGEFGWLRGASANTWLQRYDLQAWVPLVEQRFTDLARGIGLELFPWVPNMLCKTCTVRAFCPYGVTLEAVDTT